MNETVAQRRSEARQPPPQNTEREASLQLDDVISYSAAPTLDGAEPWLDKRQLAAQFSCSVRWVERCMAEGAPHAHIAGKAKFRASEFERWLHVHGHIEWKGRT